MNYCFQQIIALFLFILFLPVYIILIFTSAIMEGFPIFYREKRQGLNKKMFVIWKFRTMYIERSQPDIEARIDKRPNDPRITFWGHYLRRFSLDELPQLINVITGEMALIGPRPITCQEDLRYGKYSNQLHSVKPGMTGLWQVSGRNLTSYHRRIAINRYYVRHRSWQLDLWILWKTLDAVLSGRGAF